MAVAILKPVLSKLFRMREEANRRLPPGGGDEEATGGAPAPHDPYEKPFLDHLEDLRIMFMKMIVVQLVFTIGCFVFHEQLFDFMFWPIRQPLPFSGPENQQPLEELIKLIILSPPEAFMLSIKVSFIAGFILAFPFHGYFGAQFVLPGLTEKEKKYTIPGVAVGFILFLTGASFAFFIALPYALNFLFTYAANLEMESNWRIGHYIGFVTQVTLLFGLCFEMPVVVIILVKLRLLTYRTMKSSRSFAVVLMCVLSAVFTPPDPVTMIFMAVPMIILYEICIWIAFFMDRKREAQDAAEEAEYQAWLDKQAAEESPAGAVAQETPAHGASPSLQEHREMTDSDADWPDNDHYQEDPHHDWHADHDGTDDHPAHREPSEEPDEYECPEDRANRERARKARELAEAAERQLHSLVDINNALPEELVSLPGIGPVMAKKIIEHRPFKSIDDMINIPGFNQTKLDMIYPKIFAG